MPGPIEIDARTIRPKTQYAKRNSKGQWIAGPKAKGYTEGQFIPSRVVAEGGQTREIPAGDVGRQWSNRRRTNLVKAVQRAQDISESEAREVTGDMLTELNQAETDDERKKIWQRYAS